MKALTIKQPFATLLMLPNTKPYETRSWRVLFRGLVAIHAGKSKTDIFLQNESPYQEVLKGMVLPLGVILGVNRLVDCVPTSEVTDPRFGNFSAGRWAFLFEISEVFPCPIPYKGALGLWEWPFQRGGKVVPGSEVAIGVGGIVVGRGWVGGGKRQIQG